MMTDFMLVDNTRNRAFLMDDSSVIVSDGTSDMTIHSKAIYAESERGGYALLAESLPDVPDMLSLIPTDILLSLLSFCIHDASRTGMVETELLKRYEGNEDMLKIRLGTILNNHVTETGSALNVFKNLSLGFNYNTLIYVPPHEYVMAKGEHMDPTCVYSPVIERIMRLKGMKFQAPNNARNIMYCDLNSRFMDFSFKPVNLISNIENQDTDATIMLDRFIEMYPEYIYDIKRVCAGIPYIIKILQKCGLDISDIVSSKRFDKLIKLDMSAFDRETIRLILKYNSCMIQFVDNPDEEMMEWACSGRTGYMIPQMMNYTPSADSIRRMLQWHIEDYWMVPGDDRDVMIAYATIAGLCRLLKTIKSPQDENTPKMKSGKVKAMLEGMGDGFIHGTIEDKIRKVMNAPESAMTTYTHFNVIFERMGFIEQQGMSPNPVPTDMKTRVVSNITELEEEEIKVIVESITPYLYTPIHYSEFGNNLKYRILDNMFNNRGGLYTAVATWTMNKLLGFDEQQWKEAIEWNPDMLLYCPRITDDMLRMKLDTECSEMFRDLLLERKG